MDFDRLENEVLKPFWKNQKTIKYGHFDVPSKSISETIEINSNGTLIIEGVGLFRPKLHKYLTYKIWIDVPLEVAIARGKKRDKDEFHSPADGCWDGIWKENDIQYFDAFKPKDAADLIIQNLDDNQKIPSISLMG
jgi:uridine kinase